MESSPAMFRVLLVLLAALLVGCQATGAGGQRQEASYLETIRGSGVRFEMVWIPEGGFWMGRTEVTWDEYLLYCDFEESGQVPPVGVDAVTKPSKPLDQVPFDKGWGKGRRPAMGMSWNAAQKYCQWLSRNTGRKYRLPTETEWELACGSGPATPLEDHAWYARNSQEKTQEVGGKRRNPHGLFDMLGNLWEYCQNPYDVKEPERAVLRGGSWKSPAAKVSSKSRLAFNDLWVLDDPNVPPGVWWIPEGQHLGFRLLRAKGESP